MWLVKQESRNSALEVEGGKGVALGAEDLLEMRQA